MLIVNAASNELLLGENVVRVEVHLLEYRVCPHFRTVLGARIRLSHHQVDGLAVAGSGMIKCLAITAFIASKHRLGIKVNITVFAYSVGFRKKKQ